MRLALMAAAREERETPLQAIALPLLFGWIEAGETRGWEGR
jgi:hypothetical protein